ASGSTVTVQAAGVSVASINVTNTTGTYTFQGGSITSSTPLTKSGAGTLVLGTQFSNGITLNEGTLRTSANEVLSDSGSITASDGTTADLNGKSDTVGPLNLTGTTVTTGAGLLTGTGNVTAAASPTDKSTTISGR